MATRFKIMLDKQALTQVRDRDTGLAKPQGTNRADLSARSPISAFSTPVPDLMRKPAFPGQKSLR